MNTDSSTVVTKCLRPSCSKVSRIDDEEGSRNPILSGLRSTLSNEISAPRGLCFGDRWFCSVECLEWGMGQEILQLFSQSMEKAISSRPKVGTMLLVKKWITAAQLSEALELQRKQGGRLGWWLVDLGYVTEKKLIMALSEQLRLPWMSDIKPARSDRALQAVPKMLCKRFNVFPLEFGKDDKLVIAVDCGFTDEMVDAIEEVVGCKAQPFMTKREVLRSQIREHEEFQADNTADVIEGKMNFANRVGQRFVKKWFDFEAEKARFGLFEDTLWVRYLKGDVVQDHFMLFSEPVAATSDPLVADSESVVV